MIPTDWQERLNAAGYSFLTVTDRQAAKVWGVSRHAARHKLARARGRGWERKRNSAEKSNVANAAPARKTSHAPVEPPAERAPERSKEGRRSSRSKGRAPSS